MKKISFKTVFTTDTSLYYNILYSNIGGQYDNSE